MIARILGPNRTRRRRGVQLALTAVMMPVLVGMTAVSVDTGVRAAARAQLRTVADAAALAGAMKLVSENHTRQNVTSLATEMNQARSAAIAAASANRVLKTSAVVLNNPLNLATGEIVIGYLAPTDLTSAGPSTTAPVALFNSVQVRARRDPAHGGLIPAYLSQIFGNAGSTMEVSSVATVMNYNVAGFRSVNNRNANLLPIVLDKNAYDAMINGTTTDQFTYCPPNGSSPGFVSAGADGITESRLFPVASGHPGNWGTINIGVTNNSTATLGRRIRHGITPAQLATYPNSTISLNSVDNSTNPPTFFRTFSGNPGISAGIKDDLASIIGKPVFIPIYDQSGGNGNNAWFRVIKFAGARILSVNFQGNPKFVIIQPALVNEVTALSGAPEPAWKRGGLVRIYLSR